MRMTAALGILVLTLGTAQSLADTAAEALPVLYSPYDLPDKLDAVQYDRLAAIAARNCPEGATPWFMLVDSNRTHGEQRSVSVRVFYSPEDADRPVWRGKMLHLTHWTLEDLAQAARPRTPEEDSRPRNLSDYACPAPAKRDALAPLPIPSLDDLPSTDLASFEDEQVVRLSEFVRDVKRRPNGSERMPQSILSITRRGEELEIKLGWIAGPRNGMGISFQCRMRNGEYVLIGRVMSWVS